MCSLASWVSSLENDCLGPLPTVTLGGPHFRMQPNDLDLCCCSLGHTSGSVVLGGSQGILVLLLLFHSSSQQVFPPTCAMRRGHQ